MGVHTYKIERLDDTGTPEGAYTYEFQDLVGTVVLASEKIEILRRRGVDGSGLRAVGSIEDPFGLRATWFEASWSDAKDKIAALKALKGHLYGVKLTKDSLDYGTFDVVEVAEQPPRAVTAVAGSLVANPQVIQRAMITLIDRPEA